MAQHKSADEIKAQADAALEKLEKLSQLMQPTNCPFEAKQQLTEIKAIQVNGEPHERP